MNKSNNVYDAPQAKVIEINAASVVCGSLQQYKRESGQDWFEE